MNEARDGAWYIDLYYQGEPNLIASAVIETEKGLVIVDPGPSVTASTLKSALAARGFGLSDVHGLLLTHIHLDHAGVCGSLVKEHIGLKVYVHEIGARHMISPARLLASARRLYGDRMDTLWGEFRPVPEKNIVSLRGGESLAFVDRTLQVGYTPGHAIHHVSYLDERTGTAYVGDVGGMRVSGDAWVIPVTPPPDISLEQWRVSLDVIRLWKPRRLFLTHFGPSENVDWHLDTLARNLEIWAERVRQSLEADGENAEKASEFSELAMSETKAALPAGALRPYELMGRPDGSWYGLARYWRRVSARQGIRRS